MKDPRKADILRAARHGSRASRAALPIAPGPYSELGLRVEAAIVELERAVARIVVRSQDDGRRRVERPGHGHPDGEGDEMTVAQRGRA